MEGYWKFPRGWGGCEFLSGISRSGRFKLKNLTWGEYEYFLEQHNDWYTFVTPNLSMFSEHGSVRTKWSRGVVQLPWVTLRYGSPDDITLRLSSNWWQHIRGFTWDFLSILSKVLSAIRWIETFLIMTIKNLPSELITCTMCVIMTHSQDLEHHIRDINTSLCTASLGLMRRESSCRQAYSSL